MLLKIASLKLKIIYIQRWGNGSNSSSSSVDISKNIELTQFKYRHFKTVEKKFELSTGILQFSCMGTQKRN